MTNAELYRVRSMLVGIIVGTIVTGGAVLLIPGSLPYVPFVVLGAVAVINIWLPDATRTNVSDKEGGT